MREHIWAIVHQDVSLEPGFLVTGHRGGCLLWGIVQEREHALKLCHDHLALGYRHLKIAALVVGEAQEYQPWMGAGVALGGSDG